MWHALRGELVYSRPYLLGGMGIATGAVVVISVLFAVDDSPPSFAAAGMRAMFLILAPMIVGFIAQTYRSEEHRARLLLAGPLTPRQLAGAMVLLPAVFLWIGVAAAGLVMGTESLLTGSYELESLSIAGFVGGQLLAYVQMGLLAQESTAARNQRRNRAAAAGWAGFVAAVLVLAAVCLAAALGLLGSATWPLMILGHLTVGVAVAVGNVELYARRTDFTR